MDLDTFWTRIDRDDASGCWLWTGPLLRNGYGRWPTSPWTTHRFAYLMLVGDIPEGLQIDHLCRVRRCANPDHMEVVTPSENTRRGLAPVLLRATNRRRGRERTHCRSGHPLSGDNLRLEYRKDRIVRTCWTCRRAISARYQARKAVA